MTYDLRRAERRDLSEIAEIWHAGWMDGHAEHADQGLIDARTRTSFFERTEQQLTRHSIGTTIAIDVGTDRIAGFVMVVGDEVEQIYMAEEHRGSGCAARLLSAAEQQIAGTGAPLAWLAVVADNDRARSFYARLGWTDSGPFTYMAAGEDRGGPKIPVVAHRYEKRVLAD